MRRHLIGALICISLMISNVDHFLHVSVDNLYIFIGKCLFTSAYFLKIGLLDVFILCKVVWVLCIFWILTPY